MSGLWQDYRHRRTSGHPQYRAVGLRRLRGLLARREDGHVERRVLPPGRTRRLPYLRAVLQPHAETERPALARPALRQASRQVRPRKHRLVLPDGSGEPVQNPVSRHAQPLSWQDHVSEVSRHPTEGRSQLCQDWRTQHLRPCADADCHAEAVVRPPGAYRTGTADWPPSAHRDQFTPAVPVRRRAGLPHAEPHVQHPVGRREPAH